MFASKNALFFLLFVTANVVVAQTDTTMGPSNAPIGSMDTPTVDSESPTGSPTETPDTPDQAPSNAPNPSPTGDAPVTPSASPSRQSGSGVLPDDLQPRSDYRCGVNELDARGNCKQLCGDDISVCGEGENCWATFVSYCHIQPEGHPQCDDLSMAEQDILRCGFEEDDARGYCGKPCESSSECGESEFCFPVQRNFCKYFEDEDTSGEARLRRSLQEALGTNAQYFSDAKEVISPYFLKQAQVMPPSTSPSMQPSSSNQPTSAGLFASSDSSDDESSCTTLRGSLAGSMFLFVGTMFAAL